MRLVSSQDQDLAPPGRDAALAAASGRYDLRRTIEASYEVLFARAMKLTRNRADAHDLVHDTIERGLRAADRLEPETNATAWLLRIMMNRFIDQCRSRTRVTTLPEEAAAEALQMAAPDQEPGPPDWARITPDQVQAALSELDPIFRETYELRVKSELSYEEISARLQIPPATVGTRLARARLKLRSILTRSLEPGVEELR